MLWIAERDWSCQGEKTTFQRTGKGPRMRHLRQRSSPSIQVKLHASCKDLLFSILFQLKRFNHFIYNVCSFYPNYVSKIDLFCVYWLWSNLNPVTAEMKETDRFLMDFPKSEVLILVFAASNYFLPPFIQTMPKLKVLVLINNASSGRILHNLTIFTYSNLRSVWFKKITVLPLTNITPLQNLQKMSLVLCELSKSLQGSTECKNKTLILHESISRI